MVWGFISVSSVGDLVLSDFDPTSGKHLIENSFIFPHVSDRNDHKHTANVVKTYLDRKPQYY